MKLHLLCDGLFTLDKSYMVYMKYIGQPYEAAIKSLLVMNADRNVLIDTGIGGLPEKYRKFYNVRRKPEQNLKTQLAQHNLKPEDIDVVVNTHLHFDHCGNNFLFPNAKIIVQADELSYAHAPERFQEAGYIHELFNVKANYQSVQGEYKIDDKISVVPTPGHSIGHQSVVIKNDERNVVYCGDAAPLRECLERRNIPGVLYSSHEALKSIDRLRAITNAVYIYSHDREQLTI